MNKGLQDAISLCFAFKVENTPFLKYYFQLLQKNRSYWTKTWKII